MNSNIEKEIKNYTEITKQSEVTTSKIYQFFKTFIGDSLKILDKSKKILEEYLKELHKEPCMTTNNLSFLGFYNDIHRYVNKLRDTYLSIEQNVTNKLENLLKRMRNNHYLAFLKSSRTIPRIYLVRPRNSPPMRNWCCFRLRPFLRDENQLGGQLVLIRRRLSYPRRTLS